MRVELEERETVHQGFFRLDRIRVRFERFGGGMGPPHTFECLERGEAVAVILYDPAADRVALIRQFRIGPHLRGESGWTIEMVAGACDGDPDTTAVAHREVAEEAGYPLVELRPVSRFYLSPSGSTERIHLFLGLIDTRHPPRGGGGLAHEGEDIRLELYTFDRAWALVENGEMDSATAILAMQWLALHRPALHREAAPP